MENRRKKQIGILCLAFVLLSGMTACGGKNTAATAGSASSGSDSTVVISDVEPEIPVSEEQPDASLTENSSVEEEPKALSETATPESILGKTNGFVSSFVQMHDTILSTMAREGVEDEDWFEDDWWYGEGMYMEKCTIDGVDLLVPIDLTEFAPDDEGSGYFAVNDTNSAFIAVSKQMDLQGTKLEEYTDEVILNLFFSNYASPEVTNSFTGNEMEDGNRLSYAAVVYEGKNDASSVTSVCLFFYPDDTFRVVIASFLSEPETMMNDYMDYFLEYMVYEEAREAYESLKSAQSQVVKSNLG